MKLRLNAVAFAAAALALGQGAWADEAEAKKWIDAEFQPSTLSKDQQMAEMKWFIDAAKKLQAKGVKEISVVSETITTHEYESKTLAKAFERDHRHQGQARPDPGRRRGREAADLDAVGQVDLRRLDQRLRPDRHALPLRQDHEPDRLHGRQGQGVDQPRASTSRTSSAPASPPAPTRSSTSCPTSSSPTCTGSAPTCSRART